MLIYDKQFVNSNILAKIVFTLFLFQRSIRGIANQIISLCNCMNLSCKLNIIFFVNRSYFFFFLSKNFYNLKIQECTHKNL